MVDITMPQLGETVTEGTITRWAKQVGDRIEIDEVLFEVSTDKVDSEVPSAAAGYVTEILVPEGETVDVGTRLAVIGDAPSNGAASAPAAPAASAPAASAPAAEAPPAPAPPPPPPPAPAPAPPAPVAVAAAPAPAPAPEPATPAPTPVAAAVNGSAVEDARLLSPVVRRLIAEHNLDPATITGTGTGGRITRDDVLALIDATASGATATPPAATAAAAPAPAPVAPAPAAPAPAAVPVTAGGDRDEVIPFSKIRKITAEHMVRSKATSAHTLIVVEVDYVGVDKVRAAQREAFRGAEGHSLNYLPFIARAVVDAIGEFPHMNASVGNDELIVHHYINLGIAVDLNFEGLLVPVVHDADGKRLRALSREIADLANRARTKRLLADDIAGGTFTLTNAGPFGTLLTAPVINQPQVAILSTDGVRKKPVVVELPDGTDGIAIHPVGMLALTFDHRAFDGAYAAAFANRVRNILETRDWSQEL